MKTGKRWGSEKKKKIKIKKKRKSGFEFKNNY